MGSHSVTIRLIRKLATLVRPSTFEIAILLTLTITAATFFRPQDRLRLATFPVAPAQAATVDNANDWAGGHIALLTPTAAFGQEENRQSIAQIFVASVAKERPELVVQPLAETLSRINAAGLSDTYRKLYEAYAATGLFDRKLLKTIGDAAQARYLVQLKLQSFSQSTRPRFGYFGISILQTQTANVRLFVQIWDAQNGEIVWEKSAEAARQTESLRERPVTMESVAQSAFEELIAQMPHQSQGD